MENFDYFHLVRCIANAKRKATPALKTLPYILTYNLRDNEAYNTIV